MDKTTYEMTITNCAIYLKSHKSDESGLTAFDLSYGIAIGFCKSLEDVVCDIANCEI